MKIKKLLLRTRNLHALAEFYGNLFLLPVIREPDQLTIEIGQTVLSFSSSLKNSFYHFAINIPCNKIEEARVWLEKKTSLIFIEDYKGFIAEFTNWNARSVYFMDPAGNIVELIARMDLRNSSEEEFSGEQFLSVSEIGIVCKKGAIEHETETLLNQYGLDFFEKQPALPAFKALGDDEGLFILVTEDRNWYPTQIKSGLFPLTIEFESGGNIFMKSYYPEG